MKKRMVWFVVAMIAMVHTVSAQEKNYQEIDFAADSTGLPGDNFSLEAALDLFKNSKTLEAFEKGLNSKDNAINNLDLNGDGVIDYIRVEDHARENAHAIVLQIAINEKEKQDVAVIEIEKTGEQTAVAQILGDEELYGETRIIEPGDKSEAPAGGGTGGNKGPSAPSVFAPQYVYVNVWFWPCVTYIYDPYYVLWVSPWYWGYYPPWFYPWPPYNWYWYSMHHWHHHHYYHHTYYHRTTYAHNTVYAPRRTTSPVVIDRNRNAKASYVSRRPASRPVITPRPATRPTYQQPDVRPSVPPATTPSKQKPRPADQPVPKKPSVTPSTPSKAPQPAKPSGGEVRPAPKPQSPPPSRPPQTPPPSRPPQTPPPSRTPK